MTNNKAESIKMLIDQITNRCIQNRESSIQQIDNEKKLILWIAGLAIGLEIFILNTIKWGSLDWSLSSCILFLDWHSCTIPF